MMEREILLRWTAMVNCKTAWVGEKAVLVRFDRCGTGIDGAATFLSAGS